MIFHYLFNILEKNDWLIEASKISPIPTECFPQRCKKVDNMQRKAVFLHFSITLMEKIFLKYLIEIAIHLHWERYWKSVYFCFLPTYRAKNLDWTKEAKMLLWFSKSKLQNLFNSQISCEIHIEPCLIYFHMAISY